MYTPWEYKDNQYVRYKREYDIDEININDLINAILDEDYVYIQEYIKEFKEEIQITNIVPENESDDYFFDVSLHKFDRTDSLIYDETELRNIIVTIVDLVLGLGIGYAVAASRYFYLSDELSGVNQTYRQRIKSIDLLVKELNITNDKIHSLSLKNGGVVNE
jgi:hypothetical protein